MTRPIQLDKTYGVLHTENYFSFLGFAKKVGSDETQKIDVFLDDKLIDTIEANEFIQKIDDMYDVESKAFTYNLPTQYIGTKAIISFKNHDSDEELLNSPYTLIDKNHEKFNEAKFLHSLSEPLSEELKNMYKPNCIGFLATKENLEDEEFVEFINQIIKDFPEYEFKAFYFDKNSIKEIKNNFPHSDLNLVEIKSVEDIFKNLEVYLSNELINLIDTQIIRYLRQLSQEIFPISLNLYHPKNMNLKTFEMNNISYFNKFFINLEYLCFEQSNIEKYGNSFHEIYFKKACEKYGIDLEIDLNETLSKAYVYWNLKLGLSNHEFFKSSLEFGKKFAELQL